MAHALIRRMTAADVAPAAAMIREGEWGDRSVFLGWAGDYPPSHLLVAEDAGRIVATGIATAHGPVGWVGTIFVAPDRRREGLGLRMTQAVIDDLESRGCRTLVLIATDAGRPLYERLGFEVQVPQVRFMASGLPPGADDGIRPFESRMLPDVMALDRRATGEDRSSLLEILAKPDTTHVVAAGDGSVRGFVIRAPWGGVSLMASDPNDAVRLLDWRRRQAGLDGHVYAGLPDSDDDRRARLLGAGWRPAGAGARMIRGVPLAWHPDWIWGHFYGALG